jgi:hypothetical protein
MSRFRSPWLTYAGFFVAPFGNVKCYLDKNITVAHTGGTLTLGFASSTDQPINDESFAFSKVTVSLLPC